MPFLLPFFDDAAQILGRMKAAMMKPISVEFAMARSDFPAKATGKVIIQRPKEMRFWVKFMGDDFESAANTSGITDLSRAQKVYQETGPVNQLYSPSSHYSDLPDVAFPGVLLQGDIRIFMPNAGPPKVLGKVTVAGVECDHLKSGGYDAYIAADGRLMRFRYGVQVQDKIIDVTTDFTNYSIGTRFPSSTFSVDIPTGFRPFTLPRETLTFPLGSKFPADGWKVGSNPAVDLGQGKPFLAVVTTNDCEISGRTKSALTKLKNDLAIWVLTDTKPPSGLDAFQFATDPAGSTLDRLFVPVTPFIYLIDKTGRIKKLWMGFDSAKEDQFIKDVRDLLAGKQ